MWRGEGGTQRLTHKVYMDTVLFRASIRIFYADLGSSVQYTIGTMLNS